MKMSSSAPAATASSAAYWISGLSTMGSISLGLALVAGRKRVPRPATGNTAVRIADFKLIECSWVLLVGRKCKAPAGRWHEATHRPGGVEACLRSVTGARGRPKKEVGRHRP